MKKFFSLVLALVMVLSLTTIAWGATVDEAALKNAAANGGSVTLDQNITLTETLKVAAGKSVTIDLNGFSISGDYSTVGKNLIEVANTGELTVKDSSNPSTGKISHNNLTGPTRVTGDTVYLEGVFNLQSGTIEQNGYWSTSFVVDVHPNAWGADYTAATVFNMSGGKVTNSGQADSCVRLASTSADGGAHPVYSGVSAVFNMTAGEIVAVRDAVFIQQSNSAYDVLDVNISGGTLSGGNSVVRLYGPAPTSSVDGTDTPMALELTGGTYTYTGSGSSYESVIDGVLVVAGGASAATFVKSMDFTADESFVEDMSDDLVLIDNGDGTYDVHATLADAVEAAQDGDTIVLLGDNNEAVTLDKAVTIETNGNAYTGGLTLAPGYTTATDVNGNLVVIAGTNVPASSAKGAYYTTNLTNLTVYPACDLVNYNYTLETYTVAADAAKTFAKVAIWQTHKVTGAKTIAYTAVVASADSANLAFVNGAQITYLNTNVSTWTATATAVATVDVADAEKCGDVFAAGDVGVYKDANGKVYYETTTGAAAYNVDGKLVMLKEAAKAYPVVDSAALATAKATPAAGTVYTVKHDYDVDVKTVNSDKTVTRVFCTECKANFAFVEGTVEDAIKKFGAGNYTLETIDGMPVYVALAGYNAGGSVVIPSTDKVESAATFDAGIAMYVGMSVMAAAGSAVVLKKKD